MGVPVLENIRPLTPLVSVGLAPFQTVRKAPEDEPATTGTCWMQPVQELTRNGAPCGVGPAHAAAERASASTPPQRTTAFCIEAPFLFPVCDIRLYLTTEQPAQPSGGESGFPVQTRRVQRGGGDRHERPPALSDPDPLVAAGLRRGPPGPGDPRRPRPPLPALPPSAVAVLGGAPLGPGAPRRPPPPPAGGGPAPPARLSPTLAAAGLRSAERPDLGALPLPAAAHQFLGPGGAGCRGH